jgi:hypothetical protein
MVDNGINTNPLTLWFRRGGEKERKPEELLRMVL